MKFEPLKDWIAVKRDEKAEKVLESGLIVPEDAQKTPQEGTVLAVGASVRDVSVGDRVMFGLREGQAHTVEGIEVRLMKEAAIWGILDA